MVGRWRPDAGGDKRGGQSAVLQAVAPGARYDRCRVLDDLRVDDHPDATQELARPFDLHDLYFRERRLTITKPFGPQGSP